MVCSMTRGPAKPISAFGSAMFALVMFIQGVQAIGKRPKVKLPDADL